MKITIKTILLSFVIFLLITFCMTCFANATGKTKTTGINIRKSASTEAGIVDQIFDEGESVTVISKEGDWYKVSYNGKEGYISSSLISVDESQITIENPSTPAVEPTPEVVAQPAETTVVETPEPVQEITTPVETPEVLPVETNVIDNSSNKEVKIVEASDIYLLPLINSMKVGTTVVDTNVKKISTAGGWIYIESDTVSGWIRGDKVGTVTPVETTVAQEPTQEVPQEEPQETVETPQAVPTVVKNMYVNTSSVNFRDSNSTSSNVIATLNTNTEVGVIELVGDWYRVTYNNNEGYISKDLLSDAKVTSRGNIDRAPAEEESIEESAEPTASSSGSSEIGDQIAEYAQNFLGVPYVYGGASPRGFDCSGFTMYVYAHFGISIPHGATSQSRDNKFDPVSKSDLQPGDIVLFTDYQTGDGIGHCGIYLGGGDFIHASSGSGYCVKISTLSSGSYANRYCGARRYVG